jgi:hypothetical protein
MADGLSDIYKTPRDVYLFSSFMKEKQEKEVKEIVIDILNVGVFTPKPTNLARLCN